MALGIAVGFAAAGLPALLAVFFGVWRWKSRRLAALAAGSRIALTSCGPVEYAVEGRGPVLLYFHGSAGGYDQGLMAGRFLNGRAEDAGFTVLAPSRPGYLRTPLETGRGPAEQADAMAALLDHLGIDKVAVMGASGGGPFALQFALRHPHRTLALVLLAALTRRMPTRAPGRGRQRLLRSRIGPLLLDLLGACVHLLLRFRTARLARRVFRGMTAPGVADAEVNARVRAMLEHPDQTRFFQGMISCMLPPSARMAGIRNDEEQLERLADFPLERIQAPVLVLYGREDSVVERGHVDFVTSRVAGAEVYPVERCGHFIWVGEHSQPMRSALVDFLRRSVARSASGTSLPTGAARPAAPV